MTVPRRRSRPSPADDQPSTRTEAVRARRRQRENKALYKTASAVDQIRSAVERATAFGVRTKRRTPVGSPRAVRRQWVPGAPQAARPKPEAAAGWFHIQLGWRAMSLTIVMLLSSLLLHMMSSPDYFVNSINLAGARYVPGEEIYRASSVASLNTFWVNPEQIQTQVEAVPGVKTARVEVAWPNEVFIEVTENEPVLAWSQGGQTVWVDQDGVIFPARGELAGLLPIVADDATTGLASNTRIPVAVIEGALQLKQLRSNIELLHYDAVNGLSYQDGRNWRGYFGAGPDMEVKLAVYETLIADLLARGIQPTVISVVDKDAPYYRQ